MFDAVSPIFHLSHIKAARSWVSQTKYTDDDMRRVVESSYTYDHQGVLRTYFNPNHNQISKKKQIEKKKSQQLACLFKFLLRVIGSVYIHDSTTVIAKIKGMPQSLFKQWIVLFRKM